jgi:ABC-2 type transport system ATP-binding protein
MKILTCFMSATSGTASIAGYDVFENPLEVKKRIGYLPESPPIYPEFLVGEYLDFVADLRGVPKAQRKQKIDAALERCNITDVRKRLIGNLSKGYRQRVGIAQALVHDPEVLILDEPTVGLDPKQVSEARGLIKSLRNERTVIYSSHVLSEVAASCDRIIVIDRGKIVAQEAINEMGAAGKLARTELVVQRPDGVVETLKKIKGVLKVHPVENVHNRLIVESEPHEELMAEISRAVVDKNAGLIRMSPVQLALEEYYLDLIGGRRSSV